MINLFSDTQTKPSLAMRAAMAAADVGDEQLFEDPTVNHLQDLAARMLGKEAAMFLPSGTMCNLVAIKTHTSPGDMILADRRCHIMRAESGGSAVFSGVMLDPLDGERGIFTAEQVIAAIPPVKSVYHPHPTLLCLENTHNYGGGSVWPVEQIREVSAAARSRGLNVHMDGARLFNAAIACGKTAGELSADVDTVWIDLSKGLGCPIGAVLAGPREFIDRARRWKQAFGGGMRQAGVVAAAGIYALQHNVARLADDHRNAQRLYEGLSKLPRFRPLFPVATNILFFNVEGYTPPQFAEEAHRHGVRFSAVGGAIRAVTHLDVTSEQVERAIEIVGRMLG